MIARRVWCESEETYKNKKTNFDFINVLECCYIVHGGEAIMECH